MASFDITCARCPNIKGTSWCKRQKKETWHTNTQCEDGFEDRMKKATIKCDEMFDTHKEEARKLFKRVLEYIEEYNGMIKMGRIPSCKKERVCIDFGLAEETYADKQGKNDGGSFEAEEGRPAF